MSALGTKGVHYLPPKPQRIQPKRVRKWMNYKRPLVQKKEGKRRPGGQVKGGGEAARVLLGVYWVPCPAAGSPAHCSLYETPGRKPTYLWATPSLITYLHQLDLRLGLPPPSLLVFYVSGKTIWAETHSVLQKNLFQLFPTVLCQKRKVSRPMKTLHHSKEGHHFPKDSKVFLPCFIESLHKE